MAKGAIEVRNKPNPQNMMYWIGYNDLRQGRQIGYSGFSPIPFSEIMSYCSHIGLEDPIERQSFARCMMALDITERNYYDNIKS